MELFLKGNFVRMFLNQINKMSKIPKGRFCPGERARSRHLLHPTVVCQALHCHPFRWLQFCPFIKISIYYWCGCIAHVRTEVTDNSVWLLFSTFVWDPDNKPRSPGLQSTVTCWAISLAPIQSLPFKKKNKTKHVLSWARDVAQLVESLSNMQRAWV